LLIKFLGFTIVNHLPLPASYQSIPSQPAVLPGIAPAPSPPGQGGARSGHPLGLPLLGATSAADAPGRQEPFR